MKDFFEFIESIFVDVILLPLDWLRELQLDSWAGANLLNWVFMIIGMLAFCYWLLQLKKFTDEEKRDQDKYYGKYWN
jgi:hypothetical protein